MFRSVWQAIELEDVLGIVGIALIATGLWYVSMPLALVVVGALLIAAAILRAKGAR